MIITKSVSRFAEILETIRAFKELGIDVYFEKENIHSLSENGELMLTLLGSIAQEESLSVSENCKWRIRDKFKQGISINFKILGYEYSIDSGKTWQDSCEFSGLAPNTEYKFVCRIKENENTCSGKISNVFSVFTKKLQTISPHELILEERTNHTIKFKKHEDQEYSKDDGKTWQDCPEFTGLSGSTTYKFTTRIKENTVYDASERTPSISITTKSFFRNAWDNFKGIFSS